MSEFQFQYDPHDLKAIRKASGSVYFSPATTISVWALGLAVCLLMLGAIGSWRTLGVIFVLAVVFLLIYVRKLNRNSRGDREYLLRSLQLLDRKLIETLGHSRFEKSWDAFDEMIETPRHFLLRHYEKITALPKRVIPAEQLDSCRTYLNQRIGTGTSGELPEFQEWFASTSRHVNRFKWDDADIKQLAEARLQLYDTADAGSLKEPAAARTPWVFGMLLLVFVALLLMLIFSTGADRTDPSAWITFLFFPIAISIPFVVAFVWWKYTASLMRNRNPRTPKEEICITTTDADLMIGYPKAIARYSWRDISSFYYSDQFIGFRPHHGMIHVIANHAFGGRKQALQFLMHAEQMRQEFAGVSAAVGSNATAVETGNPYQSPTWLN